MSSCALFKRRFSKYSRPLQPVHRPTVLPGPDSEYIGEWTTSARPQAVRLTHVSQTRNTPAASARSGTGLVTIEMLIPTFLALPVREPEIQL